MVVVPKMAPSTLLSNNKSLFRMSLLSYCFLILIFTNGPSVPCHAFIANPSQVMNVATPASRHLTLPAPVATIHLSTNLFATPVSEEKSFVDTISEGFQAFQDARIEGYDVKQSVAIVIAGKYDADVVQKKIQEEIDSAPCVMFTWEASPACKKAVRYLDIAGASYKIVRLDDPWSEGNPMRAELGKRVGRSSVPCIFIGGEYVGGFDGGVGEDSPGILEMAFKGSLREKLQQAGALLSE